MKYVSLDIETTGLDEEYCQILSIGAVIEDTEKQLPFREIPKFHAIILRDRIQGEPFALDLNKDIITAIKNYPYRFSSSMVSVDEEVYLYEQDVVDSLLQFFTFNGLSGKITIAGKNYQAFDKKFLEKLPGWGRFNIHRRVIDPATSFVDWQNDTELPDLNTCKVRAGVDGEVTHNALEDAYDVVKVLRTKY